MKLHLAVMLLLAWAAAGGVRGPAQAPAGQGKPSSRPTAAGVLAGLLAKGGVTIDKKKGVVRAEGVVTITSDYLEFVAIGPLGKKHEALVTLECKGGTLNAALLAIGFDPKGAKNVTYRPVVPPPTEKEVLEEGKPTSITIPPKGPRVYLTLSWHDKEGHEKVYAIEDLILDVRADNTVQNAQWIYFGGMMAPLLRGEDPVFIADYEQDYVSTYYTRPDGHLITIKHERGRFDDNWWPFTKRLPPRGTPCTLSFSKKPLVARLPPLPRKAPKKEEPRAAGGRKKR